MPAAIPFIPQIVSGGTAVLGSLLGKKGKSASAKSAEQYKPNAAYTQPMAGAAGALLPMAQQGFQKAFDYHSGVMANPEIATASDAASLARQGQQATDRLARQPQRGGYQAYAASQIPQQQMAAGLERRIGAQQQSASSIGQLAGQAGGLGSNIFSNLLGNELGGAQVGTQQGYLDLARTREDRDYYGKMGGSIMDILTGGGGTTDPNSPLGKLGGLLGNLGKNKLPTTFTNTGLRTPSFR